MFVLMEGKRNKISKFVARYQDNLCHVKSLYNNLINNFMKKKRLRPTVNDYVTSLRSKPFRILTVAISKLRAFSFQCKNCQNQIWFSLLSAMEPDSSLPVQQVAFYFTTTYLQGISTAKLSYQVKMFPTLQIMKMCPENRTIITS
jgi:hypothetical protein